MQIEKKVALAGPYGALANVTEIPGSPQVASLLFGTTDNNASTFMPVPRPEPVIEAPLLPPAPAQIASAVPLPLSRPASAPVVTATAPPPASELRTPRSQAQNGAFALPGVDSRTAVYDISARAVYLPGGRKLEAHSGLGDKMDNPRYVAVKNRGPTPPNVYDLSLRERPFHGVQAIRLTPVDEDKMFGRDGMLAHSYMLGPNGQSNGCVSFSDYRAFLQAFRRGEIDRLVVVARLTNPPSPALMSRRRGSDRFAANSY